MDARNASPLLFLDALHLLPRGLDIVRSLGEEAIHFEHQTLIHVLKTNTLCFTKIQRLVYFRFLVIQRTKSRHWILRYDGRHLQHLDSSMHLEVWLLDENGLLMEKKHEGDYLPRLHSTNYRQTPKALPLWQLLELSEAQPDPTCFEETEEFLMKHSKQDQIDVEFVLAPGRRCCKLHNWHSCNAPKKTIGVFTTNNFSIGFMNLLPPKKRGQKCQEKVEIHPPVSRPQMFHEQQANRSSAVSVKLTGLNLAFSLGCISKDQFLYLSTELGKCYLAMWMEYDDKFSVRYVSVYGEKMLLQTEIKDDSSWKKVFDLFEKQKEVLNRKKAMLLKPVLQKLETFSQETNSFYKKCQMQLQWCIKDLKIVVFSEDDTALHGVKIPLADYLKNKNAKFRGLTLNGDAKNDLVMLKCTGMTLFNLNIYLNENVIPLDGLPCPLLRSDIKNLSNHQKNGSNNMTVSKQCKERGKEIAPCLSQSWQKIGEFFMQQFEFDIFSYMSISLSKLSYESMWTKYSRKAGIFHHALEKTKIAYEQIIRSFSHGGFSYSAKDQLKVNDPLHGDVGDPAQTIMELDIISSYGFAGSHISIPVGFCNGYTNIGNGNLMLCEPYVRHHSFEFLSVYFTLWKLTNEGASIRTVYSNFHQGGIYSIGQYPLDLVVVTETGKIMMYQFDGNYAHGCQNGCDGLPSYIHGKSREELEKLTAKRDEFISMWAHKVNSVQPNSVTYSVKTNCHDNDYTISSLRHAFDTVPVLNNLIQGYPSKKIISQEDVLSCNEKLMFIMIAEGYIPKVSGKDQFKALLLLQDKKWTRQSSTCGQQMMFTKDYADWLVKSFNFQFTVIHKVYFYKKCDILNSIFKDLTFLRMTPNILPSTKQLVKNVINFTAGYFGLNQNGKPTAKHRLISGISKKYNTFHHKLDEIGSGQHDFYLKTTFKNPSTELKMSFTPVPIFSCIVEFGKLRMSQILCFFDAYLSPLKYRHLYTNVDNVVFALSTSSLDEAVEPKLRACYEHDKVHFFQPNTPGHLKEEYKIEARQNWKFVTAMAMNYVILSDNYSVQKNCALNNLSSQRAYEATLRILNHDKLTIEQTRRVNKMANKDEQTVTMVFNK